MTGQDRTAASTWPVGRQDTPAFGSDHIEELRWIGKPFSVVKASVLDYADEPNV